MMQAREGAVNQNIGFCTSADGTRIAYAISGEGPPLLMTNSWVAHLEQGAQSLPWKPWLEALASEYTLLRYDLRGCGMSDRNVRDFSFSRWIADLEAVIEASGFRRFHVLGLCSGGSNALTYAGRHPERVTGLVLYGAYARGRFKRPDVPSEAEKGRVLLDLTQLGWAKENHPFLQAWASAFQPGGTLEHFRSWCALQRASTSAETAVALLREASHVDARMAARRVRCPTLVLHAERDAVVPLEEGRLVAGLIPRARFVELDTDNHILLPAEPAWLRFFSELRRFLGSDEPNLNSTASLAVVDTLTRRESEVLEGVAQGLDNTQIANGLGLSAKTVRNVVTRLLDKLAVESRARAIVLAREAGFGRGATPGAALHGPANGASPQRRTRH
jgi:pimeloyl-ACP methyl ester carboxylesterase/DNA-binding CsgD family transcriptional regulator